MSNGMQKAIDIYKIMRDHCIRKGLKRSYLNAMIYSLYLAVYDLIEYDSDVYRIARSKGFDKERFDQKFSRYFEEETYIVKQKATGNDNYHEENTSSSKSKILDKIIDVDDNDLIKAIAISLEGGINQFDRNKNTMELIKEISGIGHKEHVLLCGINAIRYIVTELVSSDEWDCVYYIEEEYIDSIIKNTNRYITGDRLSLSADCFIFIILIHLDIKVIHSQDDLKFDRVIDLGSFSYPHGTDSDRGGDRIYRQFISRMALLKEDGKLICNINEGITTLRKYGNLRKRLVSEGLVESLISLPPKIIGLTNLFISTASLMVLSRGNEKISFIDASKVCVKGDKYDFFEDVHISKIVRMLHNEVDVADNDSCVTKSISDILGNHNDYSLSPKLNTIIRKESGEEIVKISDVAEIFRGIALSKEELDERSTNSDDQDTDGKAIYITQANIDNDHLLNGSTTIIKTDALNEDVFIEEGDIVLSKNGSVIKNTLIMSGLLPPTHRGYKLIPSENLYVIRAKEGYGKTGFSKMDIANVIFCHINSDKGIEELRKSSNTSVIRHYVPSPSNREKMKMTSSTSALVTINKKNLQELKIPLEYHRIEDMRKELPEYLNLVLRAKKGYDHRIEQLSALFNTEWN